MKIRVFFTNRDEVRYVYDAESVPDLGEYFYIEGRHIEFFGDRYNIKQFLVVKREWGILEDERGHIIPAVDIHLIKIKDEDNE